MSRYFAALIAPAYAIELRGVVIERGLVTTPDGVRETAQLRTANGTMVALDLGPPGGEATIAPHADSSPLPPADTGEAPLLGNAYPGVVRKTQPGAFPQYGFDVQTGGIRYELRGLAVRYTDQTSESP